VYRVVGQVAGDQEGLRDRQLEGDDEVAGAEDGRTGACVPAPPSSSPYEYRSPGGSYGYRVDEFRDCLFRDYQFCIVAGMQEPAPRVGRPRQSRVDAAIIQATRELLAEVGYAGLTVDGIAARAGIGKAAIYRRYASKVEVVFVAVVHDVTLEPPADAGSLERDLVELAQDIVAHLSAPAAYSALPGLLADIAADPVAAQRFGVTYVGREQACVAEVLHRAVRRGELTELPDVPMVHALLLGAAFTWLFVLRRPADEHFVRQLAGAVLAALWGEGVTAPLADVSTPTRPRSE